MPYKFLVVHVGVLEHAKVWHVEGILQQGAVMNDTIARANTPIGRVSVQVRTVAFIETPTTDPRRLTLTIDRPEFDIHMLPGTTLESD
jgi:hypothetical protein